MNEGAKDQPGGCLTVAFWLAVSIWILVGFVVVLDVSGIGHVIDDAVGIGNEALYLVPMIVGSFGGAVYLSTRFERVPRMVMVSVPSLTAIGVIALTIFLYTDRVGEDQAKEVDAVLDGSITLLSDRLGAASEISEWQEDSNWGCRRYAVWVADHDQALWAVEQVETVVRRERGFRVFPNEEEAAEQGEPRTWIMGWDGYRMWMQAGLEEGRFGLTVYDDQC